MGTLLHWIGHISPCSVIKPTKLVFYNFLFTITWLSVVSRVATQYKFTKLNFSKIFLLKIYPWIYWNPFIFSRKNQLQWEKAKEKYFFDTAKSLIWFSKIKQQIENKLTDKQYLLQASEQAFKVTRYHFTQNSINTKLQWAGKRKFGCLATHV